MSTSSRPASAVRVLSSSGRGASHLRASAALFLVLALASCATLAPGADPVVVRTEQALKMADTSYALAMEWYFTPGVAARLNPTQVAALEALRTGFHPAYIKVQSALDGYKAGRAEGLTQNKAALKALLIEAGRVLTEQAGPLLNLWED